MAGMDWAQQLKSELNPADSKQTQVGPGNCGVLIAITQAPHGNPGNIVLTKRTGTLGSHKGEVSFPGGYWEPDDSSLLQTALRESEEEIGTPSARVTILGSFNAVSTHQGVRMHPWVGVIDAQMSFTTNPSEVEKILFLPVEQWLSQGLVPVRVSTPVGMVESSGIWVDNELVWGATARLLDDLRQHWLK